MIGNRKEERWCLSFYDTFLREKPTPSENRLTAFLEKAKFVPGLVKSSANEAANIQDFLSFHLYLNTEPKINLFCKNS